jgi:hypothetical protein
LPGAGRSQAGQRGPADQSPGRVRHKLLTFVGIDSRETYRLIAGSVPEDWAKSFH